MNEPAGVETEPDSPTGRPTRTTSGTGSGSGSENVPRTTSGGVSQSSGSTGLGDIQLSVKRASSVKIRADSDQRDRADSGASSKSGGSCKRDESGATSMGSRKGSVASLRPHNSVVSHRGDPKKWYLIKDVAIASGNVGQVYMATTKDGEVRAMKTIAKDKIEQPELFEQELTIAKRLKHPNIIRLHDIIIDDEKHMFHLVMDLCSGGDMFDLIKQNYDERKACPEGTLARFAYEMLDGIKYCHYHKFCHRDIKPENYMMISSERSSLKLIDFGLACKFTPNVPMTLECGTPSHMAPQVLQLNYTEKCDIWSIGTTFHMLCVGRPPFWDPDPYRERDAIIRGPDIAVALKRADYKPRWDLVSGDMEGGVHNFLKDVLTVDQESRPSAKNALLRHAAWLKKRDHVEPEKANGKCCTNSRCTLL